MIKYLIQGFLIGMAYVAPIGMQNIYVINNAIGNSRTKAYMVALITIFFDISLALACFFGMGAIMEKFQFLKLGILLFGGMAVIYIGVQLIKSIPDVANEVDINKSLAQVIFGCFLVTWANPQALIDGSLLLGGFRAGLAPEFSKIFILGVCLASSTWFLGITTVASVFKNNINNNAIRVINVVCGSVLVYYGFKLGYSFYIAVA
ncbi:LysE family transporter [Clostridiaceae bacterium HSG29]|nr:LysE family transporter [Clostridiaceae bacterium HSG29]